MTKIYFADTYALIEILGGNPNYQRFLNTVLITNKLNLAELYYHLIHDYDKKTAERYCDLYAKTLVPISVKCIKDGMQIKLSRKKDRLSYADCIGYALAKELGVQFLTGDEKFSHTDNVCYVK